MSTCVINLNAQAVAQPLFRCQVTVLRSHSLHPCCTQVPAALGRLAQLRELDLSHNAFAGALPPPLGNLAQLTRFDVSHNRLSAREPGSHPRDSASDVTALEGPV